MSSQTTPSTADLPGPDTALDQQPDPRDDRAHTDAMDVALLEQGGIYTVTGNADRTYRVDLVTETCTCPDDQHREPDDGCKHLRRVARDLELGRIPRPDGKLPAAARPAGPDTGADHDRDGDGTAPTDADGDGDGPGEAISVPASPEGRAAIRDAIREREDEIARLQADIEALGFVSETLETLADPAATFSLDEIREEAQNDA